LGWFLLFFELIEISSNTLMNNVMPMTLNVNVARGLPFSLSRQKIASDMHTIDTTASVLLNFGSVFKGFIFKG
jgi:hypothetical protein